MHDCVFKQICVRVERLPFVVNHLPRIKLCISLTCFELPCLRGGIDQSGSGVLAGGRRFWKHVETVLTLGLSLLDVISC